MNTMNQALLTRPLNTGWAGEGSPLLFGVVLLASLGTGILFAVGLFAYRQRRSTRYLLIAVAVGALFMRSIVGAGTVLGITPMVVHHLIEHTFDFLIAALVLYVVLQSGPSNSDKRVNATAVETQGQRYDDRSAEE
jgi:hypothetical protein